MRPTKTVTMNTRTTYFFNAIRINRHNKKWLILLTLLLACGNAGAEDLTITEETEKSMVCEKLYTGTGDLNLFFNCRSMLILQEIARKMPEPKKDEDKPNA